MAKDQLFLMGPGAKESTVAGDLSAEVLSLSPMEYCILYKELSLIRIIEGP